MDPNNVEVVESLLANPLLVIGPNGEDCYFAGNLARGKALANRDRFPRESRGAMGGYYVVLSDDPDGNSEAEWGSGSTSEEAWRYALGALFGPDDDGYDERMLYESLEAVDVD